jgi:hypothetical protein
MVNKQDDGWQKLNYSLGNFPSMYTYGGVHDCFTSKEDCV